MPYKNLYKPGFFRKLAIGGLASIASLASFYCSPKDNISDLVGLQYAPTTIEEKGSLEEKGVPYIRWPCIRLNFEPKSGDAPLKVQFDGRSNWRDVRYAWDFNGDGIIDSNSKKGTFVFENSGIFRPRLSVISLDGLTTTAEGLEVIVSGPAPGPCDPYVDVVVNEQPGTFYEDTTHCLGAPDWPADINTGSTLGSPGGNGGWTIFGFTNNVARNIDGLDLRFWKAGDDTHGETAKVYISNDGSNFIFIGSISDMGSRTQDVDFGASGLSEVNYIKIVGTSNDGVDIDAIEALSGCNDNINSLKNK